MRSFNSLQTGRHGETCALELDQAESILRVSIPFKREGTGKHMKRFWRNWKVSVSIPFKREGTGKPATQTVEQPKPPKVSIPFKREGTWKGCCEAPVERVG